MKTWRNCWGGLTFHFYKSTYCQWIHGLEIGAGSFGLVWVGHATHLQKLDKLSQLFILNGYPNTWFSLLIPPQRNSLKIQCLNKRWQMLPLHRKIKTHVHHHCLLSHHGHRLGKNLEWCLKWKMIFLSQVRYIWQNSKYPSVFRYFYEKRA